MQSVRPARWRPIVVLLAPLLVLALARAMTHSDWAAANASLAALLFAWLVADTLGLLVLAKAPRDRHGLRALLGALTLASLVILVGASAPVRAALLAMPPLLVAMAAISALWLGWSAARFVAARRDGADLEAGFATILPPRLMHAMAREAAAMRLALFGWGLAPDVPEGASAHAYHRYLAPLLWVFLALQAIELAVVHLLLVQWQPTLAWVLFGVSIAGMLWFVALIKSIRLRPVLLTAEGVAVRGGLLVDLRVPFDAIARVGERFDPALLKDAATVNCAVLSEPNVTLTLARPLPMRGLLGGEKRVDRVALRLDEPEAFLAELRERAPSVAG